MNFNIQKYKKGGKKLPQTQGLDPKAIMAEARKNQQIEISNRIAEDAARTAILDNSVSKFGVPQNIGVNTSISTIPKVGPITNQFNSDLGKNLTVQQVQTSNPVPTTTVQQPIVQNQNPATTPTSTPATDYISRNTPSQKYTQSAQSAQGRWQGNTGFHNPIPYLSSMPNKAINLSISPYKLSFSERNAARRKAAMNKPKQGLTPLQERVGNFTRMMSMRYQQGGSIQKLQFGKNIQRYLPQTVTDTIGGPNPYGLYSTIQRKTVQRPFTNNIVERVTLSQPSGNQNQGHYLNQSTIRSIYSPDSILNNRSYASPQGIILKSPGEQARYNTSFNNALNKATNKVKPIVGFQQGGNITQNNDELYADFAVRLLANMGVSKKDILVGDELNPEYSDIIVSIINEVDTPEFWESYSEDPDAAITEYINSKSSSEDIADNENQDIELAKKGAKLKQLKKNKTMRCKCGCAMTTKKEGGKLVSKCSCGCKN